MVKLYYHDNVDSDQRLPHEGDPVPASALEELGIYIANIPDRAEVDRIAKEKGYENRDELSVSPETLGDKYPAMIKSFYEEHLHIDEEIRYIIDGKGYEDVRDKNERWIRCALSKGDFLILPPGIYHRFTPGDTDFTHAIRLFKDLPKWTAYYRKDHEGNLPERKEYLKKIGQAEEEKHVQ